MNKPQSNTQKKEMSAKPVYENRVVFLGVSAFVPNM